MNSPLKILFLGDSASSNTKHWLNGMKKYGSYDIKLWSLSNSSKKGSFFWIFKRIVSWIAGLHELRQIVKVFQPDLVIGYRTTSYGFLAALTNVRPLVLAAQGVTDAWPPGSALEPVKKAMAGFAIKRADLIHAWSETMVPAMEEMGGKRNQFLIMPRGVDLQVFYPDYNQRRNDEFRLIVTRALYPEYGHATIIAAVGQLVNNGVPVYLDIIGDGALRATLEDQVKEAKLESRVIFHGFVSHDKLPPLLRTSHIYVSMPETEGLSMSLMEAMACGCFPVVSDLPSNQDVFSKGANGFLVENGNVEMLASKLMEAVELSKTNTSVQQNMEFIKENASLQKSMECFFDHYSRLVLSKQKNSKTCAVSAA